MPSGPFADLPEHVRDLHHQAGWPGVVYNYTADTTAGNWHDDTGGTDSGWTEDSGTAITIRIEWPTAPDAARDASGRDVIGDALIDVDPTEATFSDGEGEDERASELVDSDSGARYRVLRVRDEHTGVLRLDCKRLS